MVTLKTLKYLGDKVGYIQAKHSLRDVNNRKDRTKEIQQEHGLHKGRQVWVEGTVGRSVGAKTV